MKKIIALIVSIILFESLFESFIVSSVSAAACTSAAGGECYGYDYASCTKTLGSTTCSLFYCKWGYTRKTGGDSWCVSTYGSGYMCQCYNSDWGGCSDELVVCDATSGPIPACSSDRCTQTTGKCSVSWAPCGGGYCSSSACTSGSYPCQSKDKCYSSLSSCEIANPTPETACTGGVDDDCDGLTDCDDPDCFSNIACGAANPCGDPYAACWSFVTLAIPPQTCPGQTGATEGPVAGTGCCWNLHHTVGDGPLTRCCYSNYDNTKASCTDHCSNKIFYSNAIDVCAAGGWTCMWDEVAVDCCTDTDCKFAGNYCSGYGNRYKRCDLTSTSANYHKCTVCGSCNLDSDCDNQCCENTIRIDTNQDGQWDCVDVGTRASTNKYLCTSSSPVGWRECDTKNVGEIFKSGDKSYVCLKDRGEFRWEETPNLRLFMVVSAFGFLIFVLLKKRFTKSRVSRKRK